MDAILGNIFLTTQAQIASDTDIKFVDQDTGQMEFYKERPSILLPAVLIDVVNVDYEDESLAAQTAHGILEVRLIVDPMTQATNYMTSGKIATALNYYNIEHRLNQKLHGWSNTQYFTGLRRTSVRTEKREDHYRVRVLRYQFTFIDDTAMVVPASTIATPPMVADITDPINGV